MIVKVFENIHETWHNHQFPVDPKTRIKYFKSTIADYNHTSEKNLILFYCNKTGIGLPYGYSKELKNENTLSYYDIPDDSTIIAYKYSSPSEIRDIRTFTMENEKGKKYDISIFPTLKISDLAYWIGQHDGASESQIKFLFNTQELKNISMSDNSLNIFPNGSTFQYKIFDASEGIVPVSLKTPDGKVLKLTVNQTETVRELKIQIKDITNISLFDQKNYILVYKGKILCSSKNDLTLQDFGLEKDTTFHITLGL